MDTPDDIGYIIDNGYIIAYKFAINFFRLLAVFRGQYIGKKKQNGKNVLKTGITISLYIWLHLQ